MSSMMSALSNWLVNPRRNPLARLHMRAVSSRLRKYGNPGSDLASIPPCSLRDLVLFFLFS
jgi:ubiquinol-cytochrome c reductase subunit 7